MLRVSILEAGTEKAKALSGGKRGFVHTCSGNVWQGPLIQSRGFRRPCPSPIVEDGGWLDAGMGSKEKELHMSKDPQETGRAAGWGAEVCGRW